MSGTNVKPTLRLPGVFLRSEIHSNEAFLSAAVDLLLPICFLRGVSLLALRDGSLIEVNSPDIVGVLLEHQAQLVKPNKEGDETPAKCPSVWARIVAKRLAHSRRLQRCDEYPDDAPTGQCDTFE